jgi:peptide/nickel transport system substrate-binding protein
MRMRVLFLFVSALTMVSLILVLPGCGSNSGTNATTAGNSGSGTTTGSSGTSGSSPAIQTGGTVNVATEPGTNRDPAVASARSDILLNQQIYDWLVEVGDNNQLLPGLATSWDSSDGKVWTFTLRSGVTFSNGQAFSADDVVYTFKRLQDPKVGSPLASTLKTATAITATDPTHVQFTLSSPNPEFPAQVSDYHAAILSKSVTDPAKTWVGTGPFVLDSYVAEDRASLKKNPSYWMKDDQGKQLPYLDQIEFIFSPDLAGQVSALQGDQVQFVGGLTSELVDSIKGDSKLKVLTGPSSAFHYVIHMRSDAGHPASDPRIRQALQLGTDHQSLIDQVRPGLAVVGNGTPVGPAYGDYYLDQPPVYDPNKAKQLLTQAGASNLTLTLDAQDALEVPAIATVWQQQMKAIGVTVDIQTEPPDVYYGEGDTSWLKVDFGITEWGARATPVEYFNAAYVTDGAYNESHWSDAEFDQIVAQINTELDRTKRVALYKQAQQIMIERGPVIVPFFETAAAGTSANLNGVKIAPDWSRTMFRTAYLTK